MTIWSILCSFGTFFPVLVSCTKKNLATPLALYVNINEKYKQAPEQDFSLQKRD
jgi:hypothetical protein